MAERRLAMITARGGSKRIPRKNIKEFCGKPILAYSIEAAIKSGLFDTVMVSTDDEEIAEIGKKYGAEVPFYRSEKTANDFATTNDVLLEVLEEYEMEPFVSEIEGFSSGKTIALFGSYGWGDGQWMRDWTDRMNGCGARVLTGEGLMCHETPDESALAECEALGKQLAAV